MGIPDKCINCKHAITSFESVHQGWGVYEMETVVRCDCFPVRYKVGCACAEVYCKNKKNKKEEEDGK